MSEKTEAVTSYLKKNKKPMLIIGGVVVLAGAAMALTGSHSSSHLKSAVNVTASGQAVVGNSTQEYKKNLQNYSENESQKALKSNSSYIAPVIPKTESTNLVSLVPPISPSQSATPLVESVPPAQPKVKVIHVPAVAYAQEPYYSSYAKEVKKVDKYFGMLNLNQSGRGPQVLEISPDTETVSPVGYSPSSGYYGGSSSAGSSNGSSSDHATLSGILPGSVLFGYLYFTLDSSVPSAVEVVIDSGKYSGAKLMGSFKRYSGYLVISFNTMVWKGRVYSIKAVAINPNTSMEAVRTSVNYHTLSRFAGLLGGAFVGGLAQLGQTIGQQGTSTITNGAVVTNTNLSTKQQLLVAAGGAGSQILQTVGTSLTNLWNEKPTVKAKAGLNMAVLFLGEAQESHGAIPSSTKTKTSPTQQGQTLPMSNSTLPSNSMQYAPTQTGMLTNGYPNSYNPYNRVPSNVHIIQ